MKSSRCECELLTYLLGQKQVDKRWSAANSPASTIPSREYEGVEQYRFFFNMVKGFMLTE